MTTRNWTCPYCNRPQTVTDGKFYAIDYGFRVGENRHGNVGCRVIVIACANSECREVTMDFVFGVGVGYHANFELETELESYRLRPQGAAKPQPEFIPLQIRNDYAEACKIRDLSPKASATLARRCLQGMIRDFCKIEKGTLFKEIAELRSQLDRGDAPRGVNHESVDAIDAVRSVGNIGAHMEKDVDLIIDIEPGEAQMLIDLIEMLLNEWYVERNERTQRLAKITALSSQKAKAIEEAKSLKTSIESTG